MIDEAYEVFAKTTIRTGCHLDKTAEIAFELEEARKLHL